MLKKKKKQAMRRVHGPENGWSEEASLRAQGVIWALIRRNQSYESLKAMQPRWGKQLAQRPYSRDKRILLKELEEQRGGGREGAVAGGEGRG